jgi:hypothetical protein
MNLITLHNNKLKEKNYLGGEYNNQKKNKYNNQEKNIESDHNKPINPDLYINLLEDDIYNINQRNAINNSVNSFKKLIDIVPETMKKTFNFDEINKNIINTNLTLFYITTNDGIKKLTKIRNEKKKNININNIFNTRDKKKRIEKEKNDLKKKKLEKIKQIREINILMQQEKEKQQQQPKKITYNFFSKLLKQNITSVLEKKYKKINFLEKNISTLEENINILEDNRGVYLNSLYRDTTNQPFRAVLISKVNNSKNIAKGGLNQVYLNLYNQEMKEIPFILREVQDKVKDKNNLSMFSVKENIVEHNSLKGILFNIGLLIEYKNDKEKLKYIPYLYEFGTINDDNNKTQTFYAIYKKYLTYQEFIQKYKSKNTNYKLNFCKKLIEKMLDATKLIHLTGYVHCDIKPDNFLFEILDEKGEDFNVIINDFDGVEEFENKISTYTKYYSYVDGENNLIYNLATEFQDFYSLIISFAEVIDDLGINTRDILYTKNKILNSIKKILDILRYYNTLKEQLNTLMNNLTIDYIKNEYNRIII